MFCWHTFFVILFAGAPVGWYSAIPVFEKQWLRDILQITLLTVSTTMYVQRADPCVASTSSSLLNGNFHSDISVCLLDTVAVDVHGRWSNTNRLQGRIKHQRGTFTLFLPASLYQSLSIFSSARQSRIKPSRDCPHGLRASRPTCQKCHSQAFHSTFETFLFSG